MTSFCDTHILAFFKEWNASTPLDVALSHYFRAHKSLGARDRRDVGQTVYTLIRFKSLFEALDPTTSKQLFLLRKHPLEYWQQDRSLPEPARYGMPEFLFEQLLNIYGPETGRSLARILNTQAPTAVRANLLKISREALLSQWESQFQLRPAAETPAGILFSKREPLFALDAFKQGLFEVQDIGSQRVAALIQAKPGDRVLDFCSGSGGKALAIAPQMQGKGELYLHDIRTHSLEEAKRRLRRAGVQNAQILPSEHPTLKKLLGQMNWVLADVPCSGTGTLRRNPDMKWKIDQPMIEQLVVKQRAIVKEALRYVRTDGGKLVYATCSVLPQENETQVEEFLKTLPVELVQEPLKLLPEEGGGDGFFAAVFKKKIR